MPATTATPATRATLLRGFRQRFSRLFDRSFGVLVAGFLAALALGAQLPLTYAVQIGQADGPGADLPLVYAFNTPEQDDYGPFRWTSGASRIVLAGLGSRALDLTIHSHPISDVMAANGPQEWTLVADGRPLATMPIRPRGGSFRIVIPPAAADDHLLELRSATVVPPGDTRPLGILVDGLQARASGVHIPPLRVLSGWLVALFLIGGALSVLGWQAEWRNLFGATLAVLAASASFLDPPRFALGTQTALLTTGLALAFALALNAPRRTLVTLGLTGLASGPVFQASDIWWGACLTLAGFGLLVAAIARPAIARLWHGLAGAGSGALRVLATLSVLVFALRYGGKIYPFAMEGDIGFHVNRFGETLRGLVFILSKNRGVDFPYPSALYIALAPFTLLTQDRHVLLQVSAALMDAASPALVYLIARHSGLVRSERFALLAAGFYALCGAGFMPTWWNFSTHIFAQFTHLLLIAGVVVGWERARVAGRRGRWWAAGALLGLQLLVFLGHFGFWINVTLLAGLCYTLFAALSGRGAAGRHVLAPLLASLITAQIIAVLFFYSAFSGLIAAQLQAVSSGGLTGVAGRAPVPPSILWRTLRDGLYAHIGLMPLALALAGLGVQTVSDRSSRPAVLPGARAVALALIGFSFLLGLGFAILPFLSGSTLSTRWLMFTIWAIAVGAASASEWLWRRGAAGRLVVFVAFAYPAWLSAVMWVSALAWRVRPPEPF